MILKIFKSCVNKYSELKNKYENKRHKVTSQFHSKIQSTRQENMEQEEAHSETD